MHGMAFWDTLGIFWGGRFELYILGRWKREIKSAVYTQLVTAPRWTGIPIDLA
jgi:hypothetical protein